MIHEVDESLEDFIGGSSAVGGVEVSFDAPTKDWASRQGSPAINVFLYDIREDLRRRDVGPQPVTNDEGRIVDRRPPVRRFKLSYLVTAWTQRPEDEHRLLSVLIAQFIANPMLPDEHLVGSLEDTDIPVILDVALPPTADRSLSDIWSALGGELKPSIDLAVIAPFDLNRSYETGPPVTEEPIIRKDIVDGSLARPNRRPWMDEDGEQLGDELSGSDAQPGRTIRLARISGDAAEALAERENGG